MGRKVNGSSLGRSREGMLGMGRGRSIYTRQPHCQGKLWWCGFCFFGERNHGIQNEGCIREYSHIMHFGGSSSWLATVDGGSGGSSQWGWHGGLSGFATATPVRPSSRSATVITTRRRTLDEYLIVYFIGPPFVKVKRTPGSDWRCQHCYRINRLSGFSLRTFMNNLAVR